MSRFYAPAMDADADSIELPPDEMHHLVRVLRLRAGADVAVFNGRGLERRARVESVDRRSARLRLFESIAPAAESRVSLTLAQAALKGDNMDAVVRDATMLGVVAVQPLVSRRSASRGEAARGDRARDRWRRVAVASAKQCRRAVVPAILSGADFETWIGKNPARHSTSGYLLIEPAAGGDAVSLAAVAARATPKAATLIVGPEGGWDITEIGAALDAGYAPLTLGERTLRADAAAIVAIAALSAIWRDL